MWDNNVGKICQHSDKAKLTFFSHTVVLNRTKRTLYPV